MRTRFYGVVRETLSTLLRALPGDVLLGWALPGGLRQVVVSGTAVTVPFIVTFVVLGLVVDFLADVIAPFVQVLTLAGVTGGMSPVAAQLLTVGLLLTVVVLAGVVDETGSDTGISRRAERVLESVPGVGSVYSSFDRMSQVMLDADSDSFREVKVVEFPHVGIHSLAFKTADVAETNMPGADEDGFVVLFVPLAPNPVMGGFMVCVPEERAHDVDMTVQEAFQAIVTSGVAMTESAQP